MKILNKYYEHAIIKKKEKINVIKGELSIMIIILITLFFVKIRLFLIVFIFFSIYGMILYRKIKNWNSIYKYSVNLFINDKDEINIDNYYKIIKQNIFGDNYYYNASDLIYIKYSDISKVGISFGYEDNYKTVLRERKSMLTCYVIIYVNDFKYKITNWSLKFDEDDENIYSVFLKMTGKK